MPERGAVTRASGAARPAARAATAALILLWTAACDGGLSTLPVRGPVATGDAELAELARSVAVALTPADLEEPVEERLTLSVRGGLLFVKGVVNRRSERRVRKTLLAARDVAVIVLTHVPGSADDETNLALGRLLRAARYATYLPAGAMVASGGTDLFLAGAVRIVERGAQVGVHSWAGGGGAAGRPGCPAMPPTTQCSWITTATSASRRSSTGSRCRRRPRTACTG